MAIPYVFNFRNVSVITNTSSKLEITCECVCDIDPVDFDDDAPTQTLVIENTDSSDYQMISWNGGEPQKHYVGNPDLIEEYEYYYNPAMALLPVIDAEINK